MLTNEQRAHDLAMAMLRFTMDHPSSIPGGDGSRFNVAEEYSKLYTAFLDAMNEQFPPQEQE